ncbi:MAG: hypothetical protein M1830_008591, partial [Pleopsidium flavum]
MSPALIEPSASKIKDPTSIQALVLHGEKDLRIETRSLPPPMAKELQISIRSTGLCGSDLHYYAHYRNGDILVREPLTLGHESAGVVVVVGSQVTQFRVGEKVALEVGQPCGDSLRKASRTIRGRYKRGSITRRRGVTRLLARLPADVPLDLGAILEPLGVAIHAARRAQVSPESTTLVFGAGAVGLLCAAMAKASGSSTVMIADIVKGREDFALQNGFAHVGFAVPMERGQTIEEKLEIAKDTAALAGQIKNLRGETIGEVDLVFECTGVESCLQAAIYATRPGGRVMLIGMGTPIQTLPISAAALREVDLMGVFRYANTYER